MMTNQKQGSSPKNQVIVNESGAHRQLAAEPLGKASIAVEGVHPEC